MARKDASEWTGPKPKVGVAACLLGESVRYDGGHKRDRFLTDTFGRYVEWVPVCPEVECGLPVPRESMHLEGDAGSPRLVTSRTKQDLTEQMVRWCERRVRMLESEDLCGYIFKTNSPSSGMRDIKVYDKNGVPRKAGVGIWASHFMAHFPLLPVEDEGRLHDAALRENFIDRIFCLRRYRVYREGDGSIGGLVAFHTCHKLQILAHDVNLYRALGRLVAGAKGRPATEVLAEYEAGLMKALGARATPRKNANVLQHMMGYLKRQLSADEKQELLEVLDQYRGGSVPLIVPVTLLRHYVRKYDEPYLKQQTYLNPHPLELKLRNHA